MTYAWMRAGSGFMAGWRRLETCIECVAVALSVGGQVVVVAVTGALAHLSMFPKYLRASGPVKSNDARAGSQQQPCTGPRVCASRSQCPTQRRRRLDLGRRASQVCLTRCSLPGRETWTGRADYLLTYTLAACRYQVQRHTYQPRYDSVITLIARR
jgi:hypothetical protein